MIKNIWFRLRNNQRHFWERYPLLIFGLTLYLAAQCSLQWHVDLALVAALFLISIQSKQRIIQTVPLFIAALLIISYTHSPLPQDTVSGEALFKIETVDQSYGKWFYRGDLIAFKDQWKHIPFKLATKEKLSAQSIYKCTATLKNRSMKLIPLSHPEPETSHLSAADMRFDIKSYIQQKITRIAKYTQATEFLLGLFLGGSRDPHITLPLQKAGLTHLLAISGLHFSLLFSFFSALLFTSFSKNRAFVALIFFMTCYFLLVGPTPSIIRAFAMALLALIATIINRESRSLNLLGGALCLVMLFDPRSSSQIGFILSFAITASILLFYKPFKRLLEKLFKQRTYEQLMHFSPLNQHGYLLMRYLTKAVALALAVNITALPLTLYFFGKFPLISILANLLFPPLVSLLLFGFCLSLPFLFCGWLLPYHLVEALTHHSLKLVIHPPTIWDISFRLPHCPRWLVLTTMLLIAFAGIHLHTKTLEDKI